MPSNVSSAPETKIVGRNEMICLAEHNGPKKRKLRETFIRGHSSHLEQKKLQSEGQFKKRALESIDLSYPCERKKKRTSNTFRRRKTGG